MNKKDKSDSTFNQLVLALKDYEKAKAKLVEQRDNVAIIGEEIEGLLDTLKVEVSDDIADIMA
jgi:hypothetical protein